MKYTKLQQKHYINNSHKSSFCIVNSNKACLSNQLAYLIYDKVEKYKVLSIETIKQELCKPEENEQEIELDEELERNPYELLIQDLKEEELKTGHMQVEKWSIFSDVAKYIQYNQYPNGNSE